MPVQMLESRHDQSKWPDPGSGAAVVMQTSIYSGAYIVRTAKTVPVILL